jgi:hypothetical protein
VRDIFIIWFKPEREAQPRKIRHAKIEMRLWQPSPIEHVY